MENSVYSEIYWHFNRRLPKKITDRVWDLNRLLKIQVSFCLFSEPRNWTTTLLEDFCSRVDGKFIDCMWLKDWSEENQIILKTGNWKYPVVLDEVSCLFWRIKDYRRTIDFLVKLSEQRQIWLRIHPANYNCKEDFIKAWFNIIELNKIPFDEFRNSVYSKFEKIDFEFPEKFVIFAYNEYKNMGFCFWYIAEAFNLYLENPWISEIEVKNIFEYKNDHISLA